MQPQKPVFSYGKATLIVMLLVFSAVLAFYNFPSVKAVDVTTTRTFTSSPSDGYQGHDSVTYSTAHDATIGGVFDTTPEFCIGQYYSAPTYYVYRGFVYFDTSALPDTATIDNATLGLYVDVDGSDSDFNMTVQNGQPTYPHDPLQNGDYYYGWYSGNGGSRNTSDGLSAGNYWNISLSSTGVGWISKTGTTKLMLISSEDIGNSAPTGYEGIWVFSSEQGTSYAPKLYVTYTVSGGAETIIHGPFYENGLAYDGTVNVTVCYPSNTTETYMLNGTDGADDLDLVTDELPTFMSWNISTSYDYSRVYYFSNGTTFDEVWLFVPDSTNYTVSRYSIGITAFVGLSNAYVETVKNVNGTNRILEKQPFDYYNALPFWLQLYSQYTLKVVSDQGTFTWNLPADDITTKQYVITADMVDWDVTTAYDMNITITRENDTWIRVSYYDSQGLTISVEADFLHKVGTAYTEDYTVTDYGNDLDLDWYSAAATTDYKVNVTAYRNGEYVYQEFDANSLQLDINYWTGGFDMLGDWPFPVNQMPGILITLLFFSIGAAGFSDARAGCGIAVIVAAFLTYINWLSVPIMGLAMGFLIVIFMYLQHGKETARNEP